MKRISLVLVLLTAVLISNTAQAQTFVPKKIEATTLSASIPLLKSTDIPTYKSGEVVDLKSTLTISNLPQDKTKIEYGVYRQIIQGNSTRFEPIGGTVVTEKIFTSPDSTSTKVTIPDVLQVNSTSTYVFYARIFVTDDADKENLILSKNNFKIASGGASLTQIKYVDLLQSNGSRFPTLSGPTIYDLTKTKYKGVSSSTSLELTFDSNVNTVLSPEITFKKLRSDIEIPSINPEAITIKKGLNHVIIPLPVFNYESGVYTGILKTNDPKIADVNFQYVVSGNMVTFGEPKYTKSADQQNLDFNIYGTPIDLNLDFKLNNFSTSTIEAILSTSSRLYSTEFIFKDKDGKELYRTANNVDFSTTTYSLSFPKDINGITNVSIKTVDKDGLILYEGVKNLNLPIEKSNFLVILYSIILFIALLLSLFIFKHKYSRIAIVILLILNVFFGIKLANADEWVVPDAGYLAYLNQGSSAGWYRWLTWQDAGGLIKFSTYLPGERYYTSDDLVVTYLSYYEFCNNDPTDLVTTVSLYAGNTLKSTGGYNVVSHTGAGAWTRRGIGDGDIINMSGWTQTNLGKPAVGDYIQVYHNVQGGGRDSLSLYNIPLSNIVDNTSSPVDTVNIDGITTTQANINWTYTSASSKPQSSYQIQLAIDPEFQNLVKDQTGSGPDTRILAVNELTPDTLYYSRVKSNDGTNWSDWANASFYTDSTSTSTSTNPQDPGTNDPTAGGGGAGNGCGASIITDGKGLDATSNLCTSNYSLISNTFRVLNSSSIALIKVWGWSCQNNATSAIVSACAATCSNGLNYNSATNKCTSVGANGDMCNLLPGVQTDTDPIWTVAKCIIPKLTLSLKFNYPYANKDTSMCSVNWSAVSDVDKDLKYTTCTLDGSSTPTLVQSQQVLVGQHTLFCQTNISDASTTVSSLPATKNFTCQKVPVAGEI